MSAFSDIAGHEPTEADVTRIMLGVSVCLRQCGERFPKFSTEAMTALALGSAAARTNDAEELLAIEDRLLRLLLDARRAA